MSDRSRRSALRDIKPNPTTHAGLWLDRYLERQTDAAGNTSEDAKQARSTLVRQVDEQLRLPPDYHTFVLGKLTTLLSPAPGRVVAWRIFRTLGRVVVGLGQKGVLENGITLDRTWGVPVLPAPSLKGVAAAAAHKLVEDPAWHKNSGEQDKPGQSAAHLFGTTEAAGRICFLDALWLPADGSTHNGLHADVITVHNRDYYQGNFDGPAKPDGTSSPIPVSFLSASGDFLIAVDCAEQDAPWAESALQLLEIGLLHLGIGAKTNAGYGRLKPLADDDSSVSQIRNRIDKAERAAELQGADPHQVLTEVLSVIFGSKSASKHFAGQLEPVFNDNRTTLLADLVSGDEATRLLANIRLENEDASTQTELLRKALREHPETQSWIDGKPSGSNINKGNGFFRGVAAWAGITADTAPQSTASASDGPSADTPSILLNFFPNATELAPHEREALEALLAQDGTFEEDALMAIMDRVAEEDWSRPAREIVTALLEKLD